MMSGDVLEGCRWDEYLISPEYGETTFARGSVDSGLFHDCFQDCNGRESPIAQFMADGKFLSIFMIIKETEQSELQTCMGQSSKERTCKEGRNDVYV